MSVSTFGSANTDIFSSLELTIFPNLLQERDSTTILTQVWQVMAICPSGVE
jgi:hypothetical protein